MMRRRMFSIMDSSLGAAGFETFAAVDVEQGCGEEKDCREGADEVGHGVPLLRSAR
jgi:hypothetical protein